jgi:GTP-binding protein
MDAKLPKIALVGRPNVGKSTLFNRLVGRRQAIVDDIPGVTRDRQYGRTDWRGHPFTVIDTGGFIPTAQKGDLAAAIRDQVYLAMAEADAIVLVTDGRVGLTPVEEEIARLLRRQKVPVLLAVNKIDAAEQEGLLAEFLKLGFAQSIGVSAESSRGVSDLLEALLPYLLTESTPDVSEGELKLAVVGQPNVGKSTLVNALLGEERAIVHHQAGTTLDPLNVRLYRGERCIEIVDTAGIRRRSHTEGKVEKVGVIKALQAVAQADLVLLLVDAVKGMTAQDAKILAQAEEKRRGIIIVLNKWDLVPAAGRLKELKDRIQERFRRQEDIPVIAISAKTGRGVKNLFDLVDQVYDNFRRRIGTGEINRAFQKAFKAYPHPTSSGKFINLNYITQSGEGPPRFIIFCNHPKLVQESYLRYLERVFRKTFDFSGVPIIWKLRLKR